MKAVIWDRRDENKRRMRERKFKGDEGQRSTWWTMVSVESEEWKMENSGRLLARRKKSQKHDDEKEEGRRSRGKGLRYEETKKHEVQGKWRKR